MALFHANLAKFDAAAEMDARLRSRFTLGVVRADPCICSLGIFLWAHGQLNIVPFGTTIISTLPRQLSPVLLRQMGFTRLLVVG